MLRALATPTQDLFASRRSFARPQPRLVEQDSSARPTLPSRKAGELQRIFPRRFARRFGNKLRVARHA